MKPSPRPHGGSYAEVSESVDWSVKWSHVFWELDHALKIIDTTWMRYPKMIHKLRIHLLLRVKWKKNKNNSNNFKLRLKKWHHDSEMICGRKWRWLVEVTTPAPWSEWQLRRKTLSNSWSFNKLHRGIPSSNTLVIISWVVPLPRIPVTTRIITFLVGDPKKPSFATVNGRCLNGDGDCSLLQLWVPIQLRHSQPMTVHEFPATDFQTSVTSCFSRQLFMCFSKLLGYSK